MVDKEGQENHLIDHPTGTLVSSQQPKDSSQAVEIFLQVVCAEPLSTGVALPAKTVLQSGGILLF